MMNFEKQPGTIEPSIGGDVADALGTLQSMEEGEPYKNSLNPQGNPFENKSVEDIVQYFTTTYGDSGLENFKQSLEDFKNEYAPEWFEDENSSHSQALSLINKKLEENEIVS